MTIHFKPFNELTNTELFYLLKVRTDVFVVEQNCAYPELDEKDLKAIHVWIEKDKGIAAVARVLPPGVSYAEVSLGRIATHINYRGQGIGHDLMAELMKFVGENYPNRSIRISAQSHLEKFYNHYGFQNTGKSYLEDGIPHIEMLFKV